MDKTILSKHRYIYEIYINEKNEVHAERYKVIYINKKYVYYIRGGDEELTKMYLSQVFEDLDDFAKRFSINDFLGTIYGRQFVWNTGGAEVNFEMLRKKQKKAAVEKQIEQKTARIKSMQKDIQTELNEIESLQNSPILKE